jgi:hypothetical protein
MYSPGIIIVAGQNFEKGPSRMDVRNVTTRTYHSVDIIILKLLLKKLGGIRLAEDSNYGGVSG